VHDHAWGEETRVAHGDVGRPRPVPKRRADTPGGAQPHRTRLSPKNSGTAFTSRPVFAPVMRRVREAPAGERRHEEIERLYQEQGSRMWRALLAFASDVDVASDLALDAVPPVRAIARALSLHAATTSPGSPSTSWPYQPSSPHRPHPRNGSAYGYARRTSTLTP
jgi:hypothetical protein